MTRNLLLELFVEELPPKSLKALGEAFASGIASNLRSQGLAAADATVQSFATPRRLGVHISGVSLQAPEREQVTKLMPVTVALDAAGRPTEALRKRLAKEGQSALAEQPIGTGDGLFVQSDGKADAVHLRSRTVGATLPLALQAALDETLRKLPIPKVMTYQLADGWSDVRFVRPAHGLVALHGTEVVAITALGLSAGRATIGHRFEARQPRIDLRDADSYSSQLHDEGSVLASFAQRRAEIERQLAAAAQAAGLSVLRDDALLDEVTALVEWPNVLTCRFDEAFLGVPQECLILTMKANQKYFPLLDGSGRLANRFLLVSNIRSDDASAVIEGNERVVRPRLADAKFFFDQDRKRSLDSRLPGLDRVVYHNQLGSQGERMQRVCALAREIGTAMGGPALAALAERAATLAKADLLTDMVGEFPELQGTMGGYYARHDGEPEAVALAIEDHYRPRFAGDALARGDAGIAVALADKLETLAGLFGIGQLPSGDKDPFALRRHALGVIRMLIERDLPLAVPDLVRAAFAAFPAGRLDAGAQDSLMHFLYDRLVGALRELGFTAQEVDAVIALRPPRWADIPRRLQAVRSFANLPEAQALAAANKRIANILRKSDAAADAAVDPARLVEPAEQALQSALHGVQPLSDALFGNGEYTASLRELAVLKGPVDAFFDQVMVNADDAALRTNRHALLRALHGTMNRVADLSRLAA